MKKKKGIIFAPSFIGFSCDRIRFITADCCIRPYAIMSATGALRELKEIQCDSSKTIQFLVKGGEVYIHLVTMKKKPKTQVQLPSI